jgi:hypothetical protein
MPAALTVGGIGRSLRPSSWPLASMTRMDLASDTRSMPAILAVLLN